MPSVPAPTLPPVSRSSALAAPALYGRADAQRELLDLYSRIAGSDRPGIAFVTGEGGLGKTRFLLEVEAQIHQLDPGVNVAYGRALAQHSDVNGFQPFREALSDLVFEAKRKDRQALLKRIARVARATAPDWLEAVPAVGSLLKAVSTTVSKTIDDQKPISLESSVTRQFCDLIAEVLAEAPLILCLDDLHWADSSTVDLIYSLTQTVTSGRLFLVCAFREADLRLSKGDAHPLLDATLRIERYCAVTRINLAHLNYEQVSMLVEKTVGRPATPALVTTLMRLTSGNPLFLQEYLGLLIDSANEPAKQTNYSQALTTLIEGALPRRIEAVIEERLSRLSDDEVRTLEVAALLGPTFQPDALMAVLDIDATDARTALRSLCRRHALINAVPSAQSSATYAFHHATVAQVLEARLKRLDPFDYQEIHRSIAEHLRQNTSLDLAILERLAHHALESGDADAALRAALDAAQAVWHLGAVTESLRLLKTVTSDLDRPWDDVRLVAEAATLRLNAANAVADHEDAVRFGEDLFRNSTIRGALGVEATLAIGRALRMTNRWAEARTVLQPLIDGDPSHQPDTRAEALLLIGQIDLCGLPPRVDDALVALEGAERIQPTASIMYQIIGHIGLAKLVRGRTSEAFQELERSVDFSVEVDRPVDRYEALHWRSKAEIACLSLVPAMKTLDELEQISDSAGVAAAVPFHIRDRARVLVLQGRLTSAAVAYCRYLDAVSQLSSEMQFERGLATLAWQCIELIQLGRRDDAGLLASVFAEPLLDTWLDGAQAERVTRTLSIAAGYVGNDDLSGMLDGVVAAEELLAVDAIYRFDIPDLVAFRASLEPSS